MKDEYDGIMVCCPECDWKPANKLFLKLSMDAYRRRSVRKLKIACRRSYCNYAGIMEDWLSIYNDFD